MNIKQLVKSTLFLGLSAAALSCGKDEKEVIPETPSPIAKKVYALGIGVSTTSGGTNNYVVQVDDLMTGTISVTGNGILQEGYRDYASAPGTFYSIGGLGVTDVNKFTLDATDKLTNKTGLTFEVDNNQLVDVDGTGKTFAGVSMPSGPTIGLNAKFYTLDVLANTLNNKKDVAMTSIYPSSKDWIFHTGLQVSGSKAYQTFYPVNATTYATQNTDTNYVAVYSYPGFVLEKIIKDTRTGPSGTFNTRSGLFKTESGDLYTVSSSGFGYSKATKPAGILKIANGTTTFDAGYFFNTDAAANGGKIAHAIYIGSGKLFAAVSTLARTSETTWSDDKLKLAIVDLNAKTITLVANAPEFSGNGGRSFAAFLDEGKVYSAIKDVSGVINMYQTDVATATATKGAAVQGSFLGGIARLK